jgi:AcrR family transcriptional regulator
VPKVSQAHREQRRTEILDGAQRCFGRYGYEGATVRRLEQEIGLSRGAIFNYFPNKWQLFLALVERDAGQFPDTWAEGRFEARARALAEDDPAWLSVRLEFERRLRNDPALRVRWRRRAPSRRPAALDSLKRAQREGKLRSDVPAEALRAFMALFLYGVALQRVMEVPIDLELALQLLSDAVSPSARSRLPGA